MRHSIPPGAAIAVLGALALWNCGGGGYASTPTSPTAAAPAPAPAATTPAPTATTTPGTTTVSVSIVSSAGNSAFSPNPVKANAGDTVNFRNVDGTVHHLVMDDGSGDFGDIN